MTKIKLKEWADKHGLSYLTANRHFHAGMIPGAVQLDSGTILVEDEDSLEYTMAANSSNDAMSVFLKKTVEFSKNESSVEDFAAYVISNFTLKLNNTPIERAPSYSKNKPKPEEVQKHFQQFLPDKEKQEQLKAVKALIEKAVPPISVAVGEEKSLFASEPNTFSRIADPTNDIGADFSDVGSMLFSSVAEVTDHMYGPNSSIEGLVTRSVDFDTTPQQINYTGSTSQPFNSSTTFTNSSVNGIYSGDCGGEYPASGVFTFNAGPAAGVLNGTVTGGMNTYYTAPAPTAFQPTQKELQSAVKVIETVETVETEESPRGKRGRKPFKKR